MKTQEEFAKSCANLISTEKNEYTIGYLSDSSIHYLEPVHKQIKDISKNLRVRKLCCCKAI